MKGIQDTTTSNFGSLIGNGRKYIVPKFQRDYSWDSDQWDDLWQDLEKMEIENSEHYMGYLVLQTSNDKDFYIVDGQQRFTTITLILLAAIKSIQKLIDDEIEVGNNNTRKTNLMSRYIGDIDPVSLNYNNILTLNRNNDDYYRDYIVKLGELRSRGTKSTEKLMKRCFEYYEEKLLSKFKTGEEYAQFITKVVDNLCFTIITVTDDLNAFRVFETLNARGVQLSASDLLKNYLFSLVDATVKHSTRIDDLEKQWSILTNNIKASKLPDFIRYYWNSKNKTVREKDIFKAIRDNVKNDRQVFALLKEMIEYSDVYMALQDHNDELWDFMPNVKENIQLLNIFNLKQPLSILMTSYKNLSNDEFDTVLKDIIALSFRYNIIGGKNPNDIERAYNDIAMKISSDKVYSKSLLGKIYIEDAEFVGLFNNKSFPENARNNKIIKYILGKLNTHNGGVDVDLFNDNDTIEHILPQHPSAEWGIDDDDVDRFVYRLGNLCLLEKRLNNDLGNFVYDQKIAVYKTSTFSDTVKLTEDYAEWNKNSITTRQSKMGKIAKGIWKINF